MYLKRCLIVLYFTAGLQWILPGQTESAVRNASFGVFSVPYDYYADILHWNDIPVQALSLYTGIDNNYLNVGVSGTYSGIYGTFSYTEKITNYKAWPQNMTDETASVMFGFPGNWAGKFVYYDYCYSGGKGTAMPGIAAGKTWNLSAGRILRTSGEINLQYRYSSSNNIDVIQPLFSVKTEYGTDADNGTGFSCSIMPTLAGAANTTDVSSTPVLYSAGSWFGITCNFDNNLKVGFRPNVSLTLNAVNDTKSLHNVIPEYGNREFLGRLPLSFMYTQDDGKIEYILSVMMGFYYANYDHPGSTGPGGNNKAGWVPETGIGLGININVNKNCRIQAGTHFIRIPELTTDDDQYSYDAENISVSNIFDEPLSLSIQLHR
jgi:hypothetical protein